MRILELLEAMKPEQVSGKETAGSVEALEKKLVAAKKEGTKFTYDVIDKMMQKICSEYNLTGQKLHDKFVDKHGAWPDTWIKKQKIDESQQFTSMQQVKDYFKRIGKTEAQAAAAWQRGYRGPKTKEIKPYDPAKNKNLWYNKEVDEGTQNDNQAQASKENFNKCYNAACELFDKAEKKGLHPVLLQVAGYTGDASVSNPQWQKIPSTHWHHYVTVVDGIVYDPTAGQFGSSETRYSENKLRQNWDKQYQIKPKQVTRGAKSMSQN